MNRRQYDREWTRDNDALRTVLLVAGVESVTREQIAAWTDEEARDAEWWAVHEHLSASGNPVRRYPRPACVPAVDEWSAGDDDDV